MRYSIEHRDRKNIGKYISKILSGKYSQKLRDHTKLSVTDALKTASNRAIKKTAEATSNLTGNKIGNKITKNSPPNNSGTDSQTEDNQ